MIAYSPNKILKRIMPERKIKRLVTDRLKLNRAILSMFDDMDFVSKKSVKDMALRTIKHYREKYEDALDGGATKKEALEEAFQDKKLLVNRIENAVVKEISNQIRSEYAGEPYTWLPSDADEPDPEHQLNYGKTFYIGDGEMPGDRWGCRCGMRIHVKEDELDL